MIRKLIFVFLLAGLALAQEGETGSLFSTQNKKFENSIERFYQNRSITRTVSPQVLEGVLDEIAYKIGPGDVFKIRVWGELEVELSQTVNSQGSILLPTVGELIVDGLSLKEARKKITDAVQEKYIKSTVSVVLEQLRKFRVYVTGEVVKAGTYFAQASDRISDVIEVAEGFKDWGDGTRIELRHRDGQTAWIDLSKFYADGLRDNNPYLQAGDVVYVPNVDFSKALVTVNRSDRANAASYQGVFPISEGEHIYTFLSRIGALNKDSDLSQVLLTRNGTETMLDLFDVDSKAVEFDLKNGDNIQIPAVVREVYVRGAVANPGPFPYLANYTAKDYAGQAGALDTGTDPDGYLVVHASTGDVEEGADVIVEKGDTVIVPKSGRELFKDYLTIVTPIISLAISVAILLRQ